MAWIGAGPGFRLPALVTNTAYSFEHDAAVRAAAAPSAAPPVPDGPIPDRRPPLAQGVRGPRPRAALLYVAALRLAPLAPRPSRSPPRASRVLAFVHRAGGIRPGWRGAEADGRRPRPGRAGPAGPARSSEPRPPQNHPPVLGIIIWLAARGAPARRLLIAIPHPVRAGPPRSASRPACCSSIGDISAKLIGYGGAWLLALVSLILGYGIGDQRPAVGLPEGPDVLDRGQGRRRW